VVLNQQYQREEGEFLNCTLLLKASVLVWSEDTHT